MPGGGMERKGMTLFMDWGFEHIVKKPCRDGIGAWGVGV